MRPKVLLVDDELDVLRSTEMFLDRIGYDCTILPDGRLVGDLATKVKPDIIVLDLVMPGVDMAGVVRDLRRNPATSKIPLVFFSASGEVAQVSALYDAAAYLAKPFGEQELRDVLSRALTHTPENVIAWSVPGQASVRKTGDPQEGQRQIVRDYFHDYWNTLTALNNYAHFLRTSPHMGPAEKEAAQEINRLVLELEAKTDSLRSQLLSFVG